MYLIHELYNVERYDNILLQIESQIKDRQNLHSLIHLAAESSCT